MAEYLPPSENVALFDTLNFNDGNSPLTYNKAVKYFLRYPNAQGTENLQITNVNGLLTANAGIKTATLNPTTTSTNLDIAGDTTTSGDVYIGNGAGRTGAIRIGDNSGYVAIGTNNDNNIQLGKVGGTGTLYLSAQTIDMSYATTLNLPPTIKTNNYEPKTTSDNVSICDTQDTGTLNIATNATRSGAINIGTGATTAKTITIGNNNPSGSSINIYSKSVNIGGAGTTSINAEGASGVGINIGTTQTNSYINIGTSNTRLNTGVINIGTGSGNAGAINIGTGTNFSASVNIGTGTSNTAGFNVNTSGGNVNIGNDTYGTNIKGATLAIGTSASTINLNTPMLALYSGTVPTTKGSSAIGYQATATSTTAFGSINTTLVSQSLQSGVWHVEGCVFLTNSGTVTAPYSFTISISGTAGAHDTTRAVTSPLYTAVLPSYMCLKVDSIVIVGVTATWYLVGNYNTGAPGTQSVSNSLRFTRIA